VGRETVRSYFGEVDPTVIEDDIESWLMRNDLIRVNGTGREITDSGRYTLRKLKESNGKS
jgi:Holliday junction resolvasome RuvABC ATP-dependent DNA helicase subunit